MSTDSRFDGPGPDALWSEALKAGHLRIQVCDRCGTAQFPPALSCRNCGAPKPPLTDVSGHGTVYSATTVRSRSGDYNVSIVELGEGPRIMSRVDTVAPDEVSIGLAVTAHIVDEEEKPVVVFRPKGWPS